VRLSLVIPAYNEKKRIGGSLRRVAAYLGRQSYEFEVIVVDDGSTDGTASIVTASLPTARLISYTPNRGKGHAVKTGMLQAQGAYRMFYDADGSTPIEELEKLWPRFDDGADVVIGSRSLPESDVRVRQHWVREYMGRTFNVFVKLLVLRGFVDTQCGFKGFTAKSAEILFSRQTRNGFSFDAELLYIAKKHGQRIDEIPVRWLNSPASSVKTITDSLRMLRDLLVIRLNDLTGKYA